MPNLAPILFVFLNFRQQSVFIVIFQKFIQSLHTRLWRIKLPLFVRNFIEPFCNFCFKVMFHITTYAFLFLTFPLLILVHSCIYKTLVTFSPSFLYFKLKIFDECWDIDHPFIRHLGFGILYTLIFGTNFLLLDFALHLIDCFCQSLYFLGELLDFNQRLLAITPA